MVLKGLLVRRMGSVAAGVGDACAHIATGTNATLDHVNALVGIYKSVQNFAFLPYQLLLAVTFVVFPVVSRATFDGDRETRAGSCAARCGSRPSRCGAMLTVLVGRPGGVLRLAYRPDVEVGAAALRTSRSGKARSRSR